MKTPEEKAAAKLKLQKEKEEIILRLSPQLFHLSLQKGEARVKEEVNKGKTNSEKEAITVNELRRIAKQTVMTASLFAEEFMAARKLERAKLKKEE